VCAQETRLPIWQQLVARNTRERHNDERSAKKTAFLPHFVVARRGTRIALVPLLTLMKTSARSFSSAGKVSRSALIAGALLAAAFAVTGVVVAHAGTGDERTAAIDAGRQVLSAAEAWKSENADGCPTITQLMEDGALDKDVRTDDPWGNRYRIVCDGAHASVHSAGPDRRAGTPDDVSIERDDG
jgi:hypothetical protein